MSKKIPPRLRPLLSPLGVGILTVIVGGLATYGDFRGGQREISKSVEMTATVEPYRLIVVGADHEIIEVVSNTATETEPKVALGSETGAPLPYSGDIRKRYENLKPSLDFSTKGIVYEKRSGSPWDDFVAWVRSLFLTSH